MIEVSQNSTTFNSTPMKDHLFNQGVFDNHRSQLLRLIINYYTTLRLHYFGKMHTLAITEKNV